MQTKLADTAGKQLADHTVVQYGGHREVVLHSSQLLSGSLGGVLQAIAAYIATNPTADVDTFVITDGTTTHAWTFKAARAVAFEVAIGVSAAATQTNLIAAIVADSSLWTAVATTGLGSYFAAAPAAQFFIHRRAVPTSAGQDRVHGAQTVAAGIKVAAFGQAGYTTSDATEGNIPATDPGAKRFGFGRALDQLAASEEHRAVEQATTYAWNPAGQAWRQPAGILPDLLARIPTLGTQPAAGSVSVTMASDTAKIADAVSMGADAYSSVITMAGRRHAHLQLESAAAGTRVGVVYVQVSDDGATYYNKPLWNVITGAYVAGLTVSTLTALAEELEIETTAAFVRVFFDFTSGTGTLNAWATVK